jgi:hypothetical protein
MKVVDKVCEARHALERAGYRVDTTLVVESRCGVGGITAAPMVRSDHSRILYDVETIGGHPLHPRRAAGLTDEQLTTFACRYGYAGAGAD